MPKVHTPIPPSSDAFLAAIVSSSSDAICSKDLNGIVTSWNRGAQSIFGYTAAEIIGQPISILFPDDRLDEEPAILARIRRGELIEHYETVRKRKDGKPIDVALTVSPIHGPDGTIIGASKIARDITRLKRIEGKLRVTLASIGDAVMATDSDGRIEFMNAMAENLTGWKEAEALSRPMEDVFRIISEETRRTVESPVAVALKEGRVVGLANHTLLIAKDGREVAIDDSAAPIVDGAKNLLGVVLVFRDVAARREAEIAALRLASIIEGSDDAIIKHSPTACLTICALPCARSKDLRK